MASLVRIFRRSCSTTAKPRNYYQEKYDAALKEGEKAEFWKKVYWYVAFPSGLLTVVHCYFHEEPEQEEYKPYEHLNIMKKKFPWGDGTRTLFQNETQDKWKQMHQN